MDYFLFDGIQLPAELHEKLRTIPACHWVYGDLADEQAHSAGPILAAACEASALVATELCATRLGNRALTVIESGSDMAGLAMHFHALRHLHTHDRQRYFFRFADTRAFDLMWRIMTPQQQATVMAPVNRWQYTGRDGRPVVLQSPAGQRAAALPLRLGSGQLDRLIDGMWPDQLLAAVAEQNRGLVDELGDAESHRLTHELCAVLRRASIETHAVRLAAMQTVLQSRGSALEKPEFETALRQAQASGDPMVISRFDHAPTRCL